MLRPLSKPRAPLALREFFWPSAALISALLALFIFRQLILRSSMEQVQIGLMSRLVREFVQSPGALKDVAHFLASVVLLHTLYALLISYMALGVKMIFRVQSRMLTVTLCFALLTLVLLQWTSNLFPNSTSGFLSGSAFSTTPAIWLTTCASAILVAAGLSSHVRLAFGLLAICGGLVVAGQALSFRSPPVIPVEGGAARNVIIIGIDALRPDHLGLGTADARLTPNLDRFIERSTNFTDAFTPIARTYTSWFSILSGRHPARSGVRFNLQKFDKNILAPSDLQLRLGQAGYRSIFAMDERRFCNIDERYGFDDVIGPNIGAADFLLFPAAEIPTIAVIANTALGRLLFPFIYMNRGVYSTYAPESFTNRVIEKVGEDADAPLFLAVHLALPHWPYLSKDVPRQVEKNFTFTAVQHGLYQHMLGLVDQQFGQLMDGLDRLGVTDDALIFLVSDHGEGFSLAADQATSGVVGASFPTATSGHGTNVLNEGQFRVVLSVQDRGPGKAAATSRRLVSLIDIAPTIVKWLEPTADMANYDGVPLPEVVECQSCARETVPLFIESSIATSAMLQDEAMDAARVVAEGLGYYTIDDDGLVIVRPEVVPVLMSKQRAAVTSEYIVAHVPSVNDGFVVLDRARKTWWPSSHDFGDKQHKIDDLTQRLCAFYGADANFDPQGLCAAPMERSHQAR